jgi:hypothetical protein
LRKEIYKIADIGGIKLNFWGEVKGSSHKVVERVGSRALQGKKIKPIYYGPSQKLVERVGFF